MELSKPDIVFVINVFVYDVFEYGINEVLIKLFISLELLTIGSVKLPDASI